MREGAGSTKDSEKRTAGLGGEIMTADEISVQRTMLDVNNPTYDIRSPPDFATTDYVVYLGASQVSTPSRRRLLPGTTNL